MSRKFQFTVSSVSMLLTGTIVSLIAIVCVLSSIDRNKKISPAQQCHRTIAKHLDLYGLENNPKFSAMNIDALLKYRFEEAMQQPECYSFDWTFSNSTMPDLSGNITIYYEADGQRKKQTTFLVGRKIIR